MVLYMNRGRLEIPNCFWIFLGWKCKRGVASLKMTDDMNMQMKLVQSEDGSEIIIPMKDMTETPRVLGCYVVDNGTWTREFRRWVTEAMVFTAKIQKAKFSQICDEKLYNTMWIPRIRYVALVVCFNKKQCSCIYRKMVRQCLGTLGFNRNFPRTVDYSLSMYGGMKRKTMASLQIYEKIKFVMKHIRDAD